MAYRIKPIDDREMWDGFIIRHAPSALFQSWDWGEVVHRTGQSIWRIGVFDGSTLLGIAAITKVAAKRGVYLHIRHGPVFISQNEGLWKATITYVKKKAADYNASWIRVSPLLPPTYDNERLLATLGFIPSAIHAMDAEICWVLDIDKPADALLSAMRKTTRYEIRKALKMGIDVRVSQSLSDLDPFLRLYENTAKRHGFIPHMSIREEFDVYSRENRAILIFGQYDRKLLAAALILFVAQQAVYHHGASLPTHLPVSYLLQWRAIQEAKDRGYKLYNFWGIAPENKQNHPWRGLTLFKMGFGGRVVAHIHAHDYIISPRYAVPRLIEEVQKRIRGY